MNIKAQNVTKSNISLGSDNEADVNDNNNIPVQPVTGQDIDYNAKEYRVRLVADLSAAAFRTHQDKELALWHCLRVLDTTGSGGVRLTRELTDQLQDIFGYSRSTLFRILSAGEGLFWTRIATKWGTTIQIEGVKSLFLYFDITLFNSARWYEVDAESFNTWYGRRLALWASMAKPKSNKDTEKHKRYRSWLFSQHKEGKERKRQIIGSGYTWEGAVNHEELKAVKKHLRLLNTMIRNAYRVDSHPVSRDTLEEYNGTTPRTQLRRDKRSAVKRTSCWRPNNTDHKRLPNKYHHDQLPGPRGMLPRVRREVKSLISDKAISRRLYFGDTTQLTKTTNKPQDSVVYVLTRRNERQKPGRVEYTEVLV